MNVIFCGRKKKTFGQELHFFFLVKIDKKEKKHREKRADKNSSVDHDLRLVFSTNIITDFIKAIYLYFSSEEFIRMNNLQSETVAIHSPESGNTNIF